MPFKIVFAIFLLAFTFSSILFDVLGNHSLGLLPLFITVATGATGFALLWRTAEEQVPEE